MSNCFDKASTHLKGRWNEHFGNDNPIILELGCGRADLSYALAQKYPDRNYIGIDVKPVRMWHSATKAAAEGVTNLAFLHAHLLWLPDYFAPGEVESIWITFPDPFPKNAHVKHRMINPNFLERYRNLLRPGGVVEFKTDNLPLFQYALEVFVQEQNIDFQALSFNLHEDTRIGEDAKHLTQYERLFMGEGVPIKYVRFTFSPNPA